MTYRIPLKRQNNNNMLIERNHRTNWGTKAWEIWFSEENRFKARKQDSQTHLEAKKEIDKSIYKTPLMSFHSSFPWGNGEHGYSPVKLQTVLFWAHFQGGSNPKNAMMRGWKVTGTIMIPTTKTSIHWNRPIPPIFVRKPSTLSVMVWGWTGRNRDHWRLIFYKPFVTHTSYFSWFECHRMWGFQSRPAKLISKWLSNATCKLAKDCLPF